MSRRSKYYRLMGVTPPEPRMPDRRRCDRCAASQLLADRLDGHPVWDHPEMRRALAVRDIATVFRLLQRHGLSQRRIAALTGQSQSEISEILGGRQVVSYEVLLRICTGLGIPRGRLGLAFDTETVALLDESNTGAGPVARPERQLELWEIYEQLEQQTTEDRPDEAA